MENLLNRVGTTLILSIAMLFVVTSASAQFCTHTTQDVVCNGEATGIITFTPSGGTAPYDYEWSHNPVINTNQATNLNAGTYMITVSDAVGSSEVCTVEIFEPTPITITNVVEVDPMCGLMDGSLEITAVPQSGGSLSDLMYSIDGGATFQTSNLFTGLGAGDYLIIVADINGCFIIESRQLVDADSVTVDVVSAMCDPGGTISIDITANGGTLPYTYLWSNGAISEDLMAVPPGNYMVTVTDREGCSAVGDYTVDNCCDASMFCSGVVTNVTCNGDGDGSINVSPVGGTAPYMYTWSHDGALTSNIANNLSGGFYNVTIADALGCQTVCGFDVLEATALTIDNVTPVNPMCGGTDGSITITATPPSNVTLADLSYSIDGGMTSQSSNTFTNLGAGSYDIVVSDINGCFAMQTISLMDAGGVSVNLMNSSCISGTMVSITVMASGGLAPYSYAWTGEPGFTNPMPNEVNGPQGTYSVTVTDSNGCTAAGSYTQNNCCDSGMFCTSNIQNVTCNAGTNGSIAITPNGGTGPYTYSWSNDAANTSNSDTDLPAGFYNITVTDAGACSAVCGIDILEPSPIIIDNIIEQDPSCGLDNGSMIINATPKTGSGCSALEYSVDGGMNYQISNTFNNLPSGDYLVVVRDCDNCMAIDNPQLMNTGGLNISFNTNCVNGLVDIDVTVSGGSGPYSYAWTGPNGYNSTSEDVVGGDQGTYNLTATDNVGCSGSVMITQNMCCDLQATCPPNMNNISCANFPAIPAEFLNADSDGGMDAIIFANMGGSISTFPAPCGDVVITASDSPSGTGCANDPLVVLRSFTITDGVTTIQCGMTLESIDSSAPNINNQASDLIVDCPSDLQASFDAWLNANGGANATDDCGGAVTWTNDWVGGVINFGITYTVMFTVSDACGNFDITAASFTGLDCSGSGDISGEVWEDQNGDGTQGTGDGPIDNIPVSLFTDEGVLVSTDFTDNSGGYLFEDIPFGNYIVHFGVPDEYSFTLPNVGDDSVDSDVDNANGLGTTSLINHNSGNTIIDAGIHICIPVGELVWFDTNQNDQWDPEENGINGMQVRVWKQGLSTGFFEYDYVHTGPKPGTPSDDGYYKFCLPPGTYYLEFMIPPFGLVPVVPGVGGSANDSDVTGMNGPNTTDTFTILSGEEYCDISAGYYPMATIGNTVFFDNNNNGLADTDEFGMADVIIELYDAVSHEMIDSQTTDSEGSYVFDYLGKDDYYLKVVPPDNYLVTVANVGDDEEMDSDVDNSNGLNTTAMYSLTPGMVLENVDIGLVEGTVVAVDWVNVFGENRGAYNLIEWTVAFQNNTSHFEVERRVEGESAFTPLEKVMATSSISLQEYYFEDYNIEDIDLAYYRIVEYDINGYASYSEVVAINNGTVREAKISIAPNPFINELTIEIDVHNDASANISFWDISGKKIEIEGFADGNLNAGMNRLKYDWSLVPPGVYTTKVFVNGVKTIKKLIKIE